MPRQRSTEDPELLLRQLWNDQADEHQVIHAITRCLEHGRAELLARAALPEPEAGTQLEQAIREMAQGWASPRWGSIRPFAVPILFVSHVDWHWGENRLPHPDMPDLERYVAEAMGEAPSAITLGARLWRPKPTASGPLHLVPLLMGAVDDSDRGGGERPARPARTWIAYLRGRFIVPDPAPVRDGGSGMLRDCLMALIGQRGLLDVEPGAPLIGRRMFERVERPLLRQYLAHQVGWEPTKGPRADLVGRTRRWGLAWPAGNSRVEPIAVDLRGLPGHPDWTATLFHPATAEALTERHSAQGTSDDDAGGG
ncbi:MAG: hypothetical protein EA356_17720 [Geminicoccaceae bacterium]|nr:MAG: hypothetical protein EA356_17720 [Geminicoccaceae bacterium]